MTRYLAPLIAVYALVVALVLVGAPLAAEQQTTPNAPSSGEEGQSGQSGVESSQPTTTPNAAAPAAQPAPAEPPATQTETTPEASAPVAVAAGPGSVSIVDFDFSPGTITVNAGDTVTWTNTGKQGHSATGSGFDTGILSKGKSGSHTFDNPGTFTYHCTPHPFMKGTVVVKASGSGGGGGGLNGSSGGGSSSGGGGSASSSNSGGPGSSGSPESGSSSGPGLPATGADIAILGGLGLLLFGLGVAIRRRTASAQ